MNTSERLAVSLARKPAPHKSPEPRRAPALPLESLSPSFCCGIGREAPSLDPSHLLSNALSWQDHEVLFFFFSEENTSRGPLVGPRFDSVPAPARRAAKRAGAAPNCPIIAPRHARSARLRRPARAGHSFRILLTQRGQPGFPRCPLPVRDACPPGAVAP